MLELITPTGHDINWNITGGTYPMKFIIPTKEKSEKTLGEMMNSYKDNIEWNDEWNDSLGELKITGATLSFTN